jgi:hypothetical protein
MTEPILKLEVSPWDLDELRTALGKDFVEVENLPAGSLGEPVTLIVLTLGVAALLAITALVLKDRHRQTFERKYEKYSPDGTVEKDYININLQSSVSDSEVLRQIGVIFPQDVLARALANASA